MKWLLVFIAFSLSGPIFLELQRRGWTPLGVGGVAMLALLVAGAVLIEVSENRRR